MDKLREQIVPAISIIWCLVVIADQLWRNSMGLSFIHEDWASMTMITSGLFIILFSTRIVSNSKTSLRLFTILAVLSATTLFLGLYFEDRTYISSIATSSLFFILCVHGFYYEKKDKLYLRFALKFIVYTTSNVVLILYFLDPPKLYTIPGFESVSWNTATGFLLYSSTLLSRYYGGLIKRSELPEDFSILNKKFVDFWFAVSFFSPVLIIFTISVLHFFGVFSTKTGMALALLFICLLPFSLTYFIYLQTADWSVKMYQNNKKLFHREQDLHFHNELLKEFAQITSHNLRGPIVGLKNLTEMVAAEGVSEDRREQSYQLINEKIQSLATTVDSLAEFHNMIRMGKVKYQECDIRVFFEETITLCKNNYALDNINAEIEFDLVSPTIEYPRIYFENLTYNLVSNSIKYRNKDRPLKLQITTRKLNSTGIELKFRDNGLGMNLKYYRNKIFKFGSSYHNFVESSGIGLFIVKNQLSRLGDAIDVKSKEGEFTEFIIKLNLNGKNELGYS